MLLISLISVISLYTLCNIGWLSVERDRRYVVADANSMVRGKGRSEKEGGEVNKWGGSEVNRRWRSD